MQIGHEIISAAVLSAADSSRAVVNYRRIYVHLILVKRIGSLRLPRNSLGSVTDSLKITFIGLTGL